MRKTGFLLVLLSAFIVNSCDILDQASQMAMLTKCQFRLTTLTNAKIAGVGVQNKDSYKDFTVMDVAKVTASYAAGSLPLSFTLNVEAKNPNTKAAGMSKLDWILLIDDLEVLTGITEQRITIPANGGTETLPMEMKVDLMKVLESRNIESLANFGMNLAGVGNKPTRVALRAKPTIYVGTTPITYPDYITINTEFTR